jgi:hypothetical protein
MTFIRSFVGWSMRCGTLGSAQPSFAQDVKHAAALWRNAQC